MHLSSLSKIVDVYSRVQVLGVASQFWVGKNLTGAKFGSLIGSQD